MSANALNWVGFMLILQSLPLLFLLKASTQPAANSSDGLTIAQQVVALQVVMIALMWLAFGGFTTDAPKYLTRFRHDPFSFEEEQVFWVLSH